MYLESKVQVAARVILGLDVDSDGLLPHWAATLMKYKRLELGHRLFAGARAEAVIDRVTVVVADAQQELLSRVAEVSLQNGGWWVVVRVYLEVLVARF